MPTLNTNPTMIFEDDSVPTVTAVFWQEGKAVQLVQNGESVSMPVNLLCEIYKGVKGNQDKAKKAMTRQF